MLDTALFGLIRCMIGLSGVLLIYAALLLYPEEQEGVQQKLRNRLEDWWLQLHILQDETTPRALRLARIVSAIGDRCFGAIFGPNLISARSLAISFLLSYASYGVYKWIHVLAGTKQQLANGRTEYCLPVPWGDIVSCVHLSAPALALGHWIEILRTLLLLTLAVLAYRWLPGTKLRLSSACALAGILGVLPALIESVISLGIGAPRNHWRLLSGPALNVTSMSSDLASIVITRVLLRQVIASKTWYRMSALLLLDAACVALLIVTPLALSAVVPEGDWRRACLAIAGANTSTTLPSLVWAGTGTFLVLHRLMWPAIMRPLYAIANIRIFKHRAKLATVGVCLLTISLTSSSSGSKALWNAIWKLITAS